MTSPAATVLIQDYFYLTVVSIVTRLFSDVWAILVRSPVGTIKILQTVSTATEVLPAYYQIGSGVSVPGGKVADELS